MTQPEGQLFFSQQLLSQQLLSQQPIMPTTLRLRGGMAKKRAKTAE